VWSRPVRTSIAPGIGDVKVLATKAALQPVLDEVAARRLVVGFLEAGVYPGSRRTSVRTAAGESSREAGNRTAAQGLGSVLGLGQG